MRDTSASTLVNGDVCEERHTGHVSQCPKTCSRVAVLVDDDGPALVQAGACGLEPEAGGSWASPGSKEDHVRLDTRAVGDLDGSSRPGAEDPGRFCTGAHVDSVRTEGRPDELVHPSHLTGDEVHRAFEDGDLGAHAGEELAELDAHRAAADHEHPAGDVGERGRLPIRPHLCRLESFDRWADGLSLTGCTPSRRTRRRSAPAR